MKLEQQVCSLELSKKLKELGVKQESVFKYCGGHNMYNEADEERFEECPNTDLLDTSDEFCHTAGLTTEFTVSAFTVAELGEMLPRQFDYQVTVGTRPVCFSSGKTIMNGWYVMYTDPHPANKVPVHAQHADTEADARAKMLIYLLENNLITK